MCVYQHGQPVVDLWGGVANSETGRPWTRKTLQLVYSATKGGTAAHMLAERGELDLDAPVAKYWPEFAANGKADIPVRWLPVPPGWLGRTGSTGTAEGGVGLASDGGSTGRPAPPLDSGHGARVPRADLGLAGRRSDPPSIRPLTQRVGPGLR